MQRKIHLVGSALCLMALVAGGCQPSKVAAPPSAAAAPGATIRLTDDLGGQVNLIQPAQRVISLSPNLTESMYAIGADDVLVGVTDFCKFPPQAASKPKIGGIINPVLERVVALKPDLVLAARGNDPQFLKRLRDMKIAVAAFDPQTTEDVVALLGKLGRLCGHEEAAGKAVASLNQRLEAIKAGVKPPTGTPRRVLFILEWQPLFVAGPKSFVTDMIQMGGGANVVTGENLAAGANAASPWPQVSAEKMIALDPQIIIFAKMQGAGVDTAQVIAGMRKDAAWKNVAAVKDNHIYAVDDDLVTIPGPRLVDGIGQVVAVIAGKAEPAK